MWVNERRFSDVSLWLYRVSPLARYAMSDTHLKDRSYSCSRLLERTLYKNRIRDLRNT